MSRTSKGEGTKIAQAAKELDVTSVTIRRYLSEFNIETTTDENGVKVLPPQSMDELQEIRRLKEEGMTNPQVLEYLEGQRVKSSSKSKSAAKADKKEEKVAKPRATKVAPKVEEPEEEEAPPARTRPAARRIERPVGKGKVAAAAPKAEPQPVEDHVHTAAEEEPGEDNDGVIELNSQRAKHSLTCQTCGKVFEHMNPRLRDCLDCYRTKRKERRRGGDRHKNVIQHPLAQQATSKTSSLPGAPAVQAPAGATPAAAVAFERAPVAPRQDIPLAPPVPRTSTVRNYRKAIEETRGITANLKRRLERPDLPEGERRWLEQIYAYQLILHQGWRHLAEYKADTKAQSRAEHGAREGREGGREGREGGREGREGREGRGGREDRREGRDRDRDKDRGDRESSTATIDRE
jgi:DNA-binding transcriptional MerR regulator